MTCVIDSTCKNKYISFMIDAQKAIVPAECAIGDLKSLFEYFQDKAPNIGSDKSPYLDTMYHDFILETMREGFEKGISESCFYEASKQINKALSEVALEGVYVCSKCARFICKRLHKKSQKKKLIWNAYFDI